MMDDRAASTVFAHALVIGIALILLVVAFTAATTYLDNERDRVTESQLAVVSEQAAGCVQSAQRTVDSADVDSYEKTCELPSRVAGTSYTLEFSSSGNLTARSTRIGWSKTIPIGPTVDLDSATTINGGDFEISLESSGSQTLVVDDA